ncbi:hypothetical protein AVL50_16535 [Flammeovirga sp. SJP92]|nr:hypothetical protein AVL50_16535 [Flammeovirga sp. SJP92]
MITFSVFCFAQEKVGLIFDAGGQPIHGYIDPLTFSPRVSIDKDLENLMPGFLYGENGQIEQKLVKFELGKFSMKSNKGRMKAIPIEKYKSVKIGVDSFFVAKNIHFRNRVRLKETYVQLIAEFDEIVFAKIYSNYGSAFQINYIAKRYDEMRWEELKLTKKSLEPMAQNYLSNYENVIAKANKKDKEKNMGGLINLAYVTYRLGNNEKVYFDQYFRETKDPSLFQYYSLITAVEEEVYIEEYFTMDNQKVYSLSWSNKKKGVRHGKSQFFFNNKLAIQTNYTKGELETGEVFHNGNSWYKFNLKEKTKDNRSEKVYEYSMTNLETTKSIVDAMDGIKKIIKLKENKINDYYIEYNDQPYSYIVDAYNPIDVNEINKRFDSFIGEDFFIWNDVYSPLLVRFYTDDKGMVIDYEMLNQVNENFDNKVMAFIQLNIAKGGKTGDFKFKLEDGAIKKTSVFVLPFQLKINKQYWFNRNNYGGMMYHDIWFQQHQETINNVRSMNPYF